MEQMTVTAKIQISVSGTDRVLLDNTMSVYRDACNYVSDYVFRTHNLKQLSLNKILYSDIRENFGLKSQMAQSVFKTVIARYKTILENQSEWIKPSFKKPQYDLVWNRDYSLTQNRFSVNTLNGRVKLPYFAKGMSKYFDHTVYKFGTAKLVNKHDKYFLHIPVTYDVEEVSLSDICNVVGIDRGINFVVATYNSKHKSGFVNGKAIKQKESSLIPSFGKSYRCVRLHHQDEELRLLVSEKTVGCKILIIKYQRHSLKTIQSIRSLFWKICLVFVMPQNEFVPKIGMCLYHGLSMTLNRSLSIKLNRISLP